MTIPPVSAPPINHSTRQLLSALLKITLEKVSAEGQISVGIAGAPGCGKSTLAQLFQTEISRKGVSNYLLSLDNYYLGKAQRQSLSEIVHPLYSRRGVPGTHDFERLRRDLDRIRQGSVKGLQLPIFDKSTDNQAPESIRPSLEGRPQVILLEGWFIGARPQQEDRLLEPVNKLEREQDPDGTWRREMLREWNRYYQALKSRLDEVWYIRVPDWTCVIDWRWQQEQELARRYFQSRDEVEQFLACFERIVNYMQNSYHDWADRVLAADRNHHISLQDQVEKLT